MSIKKIGSESEFDGELENAGNKLVVVDFFATWCGPCKAISPVLEQMAAQHGDILFLKVDVDEQEALAEKYEINAMPTFIFIKNKEKVDDFKGANGEKLKDTILKLK